MIVQITDKFYDNSAILGASKAHLPPNLFIKVWSGIAKLAFQQGDSMANIIKVRRQTEIPDGTADNRAFKVMLDDGLLQTTESKSKLSPEHFEHWWKEYPFRISNGKKIKIGKAKAKKLFDNLITNDNQYEMLLIATRNYSNICNKLPKDPERFLRSNFWKEYLEIQEVKKTVYVQGDVGEVDGNYLNEMLRR